MITSLKLENWKSHSRTELTFGKGTNILVGRMGSGKSSVLDALCFALYGTFPKMSRRDQSTESLVNMASGAEAARVEIEFEKSGKKYAVMRKIGKKISEAEARCEGKLVQKGAKSVTEYVEGVLGVDYELFTRAIYSEQNKIDYLLSLNPRARKGEIDWLLGLGQFDAAREAAQSAYGKLSETAQLLSGEADSGRLEEIENKISEQKKLADGKKERLAQLSEAAVKTFAKKNELETSLSALEKLRAEWKKESSECERQSGALLRIKKETEGKEKPEKERLVLLEEERKQTEKLVSDGKLSSKKLQAQLSSLKSDIAVLQSSEKLAKSRAERKKNAEEKLQKLHQGKSIEEIETSIASLKAEIEKLSDEHAAFHAEIDELSSAVEALSSTDAKCPVCDSDLSHGKAGKIADEKKAAIGERKKADSESAKKLTSSKSSLLLLEKNLSEIKVLEKEAERLSSEGTDVALLQKNIEKKEGEKSALEKQAEDTEKKLSEAEALLEKTRKDAEDAGRVAKLFEELEIASSKLAAAQKKLSAILFSEEKYESVRKAAEALRLDYARAEAEAMGEEKQLALMEQLVSSLQKEADALRQKQSLAKKYTEAAESMAIYKNSLASAQSELRATLVEEINSALCEIWPSVYPYGDYGGVKLEADEKDYRLLMEKGGWREVDSVASGGERACLCLALRISFATVLTPDVSWLILDEPTHNLDADAVQLLSEAINSKIPSIVEQTFVITHDPALAESGEGKVYRLERDKEKNESTRVEKQD